VNAVARALEIENKRSVVGVFVVHGSLQRLEEEYSVAKAHRRPRAR